MSRERLKEIQRLLREPDVEDKTALMVEYDKLAFQIWVAGLPEGAYKKEPKRIKGFR